MTLYFGSDLANLEVLHVSHAVDHFLRLLAEWIERVILLQVGLQRFPIRMRLELVNQLLDCFLAGVILLLDGRMGQSLDPEVNFTATAFFVRSTAKGFSVLRLQFYQTRPNAIILYNNLPAVCIGKVVIRKSGEELYSETYQSPNLPQRIALKPNLHYGTPGYHKL